MNGSFDRSPRANNTNASGSFSPPKKVNGGVTGTTGSPTINNTITHKVKKTKMK